MAAGGDLSDRDDTPGVTLMEIGRSLGTCSLGFLVTCGELEAGASVAEGSGGVGAVADGSLGRGALAGSSTDALVFFLERRNLANRRVDHLFCLATAVSSLSRLRVSGSAHFKALVE